MLHFLKKYIHTFLTRTGGNLIGNDKTPYLIPENLES